MWGGGGDVCGDVCVCVCVADVGVYVLCVHMRVCVGVYRDMCVCVQGVCAGARGWVGVVGVYVRLCVCAHVD